MSAESALAICLCSELSLETRSPAVRGRLPGIRLDVREMIGNEHFRALRAEEIDVAVSVAPRVGEAGLQWELFYEDPVEYAILPATHPLAGRDIVEPEELRDDNLVLLDPTVVPHVMEPLVESLHRLGLERHEHYL